MVGSSTRSVRTSPGKVATTGAAWSCSCSSPCGSTNRQAATPSARLRLHGHGDAGRAAVEAFIQAVYRDRYGALVRQFSPVLVSLCDESGDLVAAAGYRAAGPGPFQGTSTTLPELASFTAKLASSSDLSTSAPKNS